MGRVLMAFLPALAGASPVALGVFLGLYATMITVLVWTAVYSPQPARRRAAVTVLRLLLPGRRPPN